tara:strand:- start:4902 stop:5630 length:729 start_codon:yes stop_codon:yes gene_type:complete
MNRIFISDLHLQDVTEQSFQCLAALLQVEGQHVDEVYILGDLVEMWVGDDDQTPAALSLVELLAQATQHCDLFLMHGNRDFLIGDDFAEATGVKLIADPTVLDGHMLLAHGDALCTDDQAYQQARSVLRSEAWQRDILQKSLEDRLALGRQMRAESMSNNANKASSIMDVNPEATAQLMQAYDADLLIHGHTHRPGDHRLSNAGRRLRRLVLGDWSHCGWLVRQRGQAFSLECFSLVDHYGT